MIPKITAGENFGGLCDYLFKEGAYILGSNMLGEEPIDLAREFNNIRNIRSEVRKPVWHASLSASPKEVIGDNKWLPLSKEFLRRMDISLVNHQYLLMRHTDRAHEHVHIVVNRIGANKKLYDSSMDGWRAIEVCKALETKYGLSQVFRRERSRQIERAPVGF